MSKGRAIAMGREERRDMLEKMGQPRKGPGFVLSEKSDVILFMFSGAALAAVLRTDCWQSGERQGD